MYDTADGQWSARRAFPSGGGGLVSTLDDYFAFAAMLHAGGVGTDTRILSSSSVAAMTTNHLPPEQIAASSPDPSGTVGWGFGVGVQLQRTGPARTPGTYGWSGGLGTSWWNDPGDDLLGILLTNQAWTTPSPPPVCLDFWTCAYTLIDG